MKAIKEVLKKARILFPHSVNARKEYARRILSKGHKG